MSVLRDTLSMQIHSEPLMLQTISLSFSPKLLQPFGDVIYLSLSKGINFAMVLVSPTRRVAPQNPFKCITGAKLLVFDATYESNVILGSVCGKYILTDTVELLKYILKFIAVIFVVHSDLIENIV